MRVRLGLRLLLLFAILAPSFSFLALVFYSFITVVEYHAFFVQSCTSQVCMYVACSSVDRASPAGCLSLVVSVDSCFTIHTACYVFSFTPHGTVVVVPGRLLVLLPGTWYVFLGHLHHGDYYCSSSRLPVLLLILLIMKVICCIEL